MKKPTYFFMLMGFPGSGKTYVSEWLAPLAHAVHLRGDDMRAALYGKNRPENHTPDKTKKVYDAVCYAARQVLDAGYSVVHDANFNRHETRQALAHLARHHGAQPVVVWVQTPIDLARKRVDERVAKGGYALLEPNVVEKMAKRLEPPTPDEPAITVDGLLPAGEQRAHFIQQLAALTQSELQ